jgi:hypothetical protein
MNNQEKPAYPVFNSEGFVSFAGVDGGYGINSMLGLTKLEAFTMAAMQGLCANPQVVDGRQWTSLHCVAVDIAKTTLAELEKQNGK